MIHTVFITPDAFEKLCLQNGEHSGLDDLRELLFPRRSEANVLLTDPHDANWFDDVLKRARKLPQHSRDRAFSFLKKLHDESLVGWKSGSLLPTNEAEWIRMVNSQKIKLIDLILSSTEKSSGESLQPVSRLSDDEWIKDQFPVIRKVCRTSDSQLPIFQKFLLNADWCLAELPNMKGGRNDEISTVHQLINVIGSLPRVNQFALDLVIKGHARDEDLYTRLRAQLKAALKGQDRINLRVYTVPSCLDRNFLSGSTHNCAGNQIERKVRWCISAQHVAINRDNSLQESTWALLSKKQAQLHWDQLELQFLAASGPSICLP